MSTTDCLTIHEDDLRRQLLPLLRDQIFHVTSQACYKKITRSGSIKSNKDGSLGNTFPQSSVNLGRERGFVCLFDLRNQSESAIQLGLDSFYFLAPQPLGDDIVFLFLAPERHQEVLFWENIRREVEIGAFHIPELECWYPQDVPLAAVARVLQVCIIRRPPNPNSLESLVAASHRKDISLDSKSNHE